MNIKEFTQPTILKGAQYGTTITIELDHSDTSIDEVMDGFLTIVKGLGYLDTTINQWIKDKSMDIYEDEHQIVKDALNIDEDYDGQFGDWENETPIEEPNEDESNRRMDIIGQNGNEGTHYGIATDEDIEECGLNEAQLKDYKGVYVEQPHFDWDDEEIQWPEVNDTLKKSAKKYNDVVNMETGEVNYDFDGGFGNNRLDKTKLVQGKIKDLKKNIKKTSKSNTKTRTN
jgi:hypothetical protein